MRIFIIIAYNNKHLILILRYIVWARNHTHNPICVWNRFCLVNCTTCKRFFFWCACVNVYPPLNFATLMKFSWCHYIKCMRIDNKHTQKWDFQLFYWIYSLILIEIAFYCISFHFSQSRVDVIEAIRRNIEAMTFLWFYNGSIYISRLSAQEPIYIEIEHALCRTLFIAKSSCRSLKNFKFDFKFDARQRIAFYRYF